MKDVERVENLIDEQTRNAFHWHKQLAYSVLESNLLDFCHRNAVLILVHNLTISHMGIELYRIETLAFVIKLKFDESESKGILNDAVQIASEEWLDLRCLRHFAIYEDVRGLFNTFDLLIEHPGPQIWQPEKNEAENETCA